ncbi:TetR/AcrR family transcriptional regulator [Rhodococcus sp. T9N]|uniref:TetR/AcrR family transcriptional regulator n=1 Tax=Rhodococcus sp. T9N TaxID=627445 RepID=UPI0021C323FD|nr:TetR/AcrR family transcriptional regulator [Rhodococcus sp. T9N]
MRNPIRPHIGRNHGSKNAAMQDRAIRTREAIIAVAAQQFDIDGYGNATINTILDAGHFARGAVYYHFPSKEAIAQQLIADWNLAVDESIRDASERTAGGTTFDRLTAIFTSLAHKIADDTNLRAGMKLILEPAVDNDAAFARWVDSVSDIVDTAITTGEIPDTPTAHRLAWNLCAGTIGATHASAILREDVDFETRIEDAVAGQLRNTEPTVQGPDH